MSVLFEVVDSPHFFSSLIEHTLCIQRARCDDAHKLEKRGRKDGWMEDTWAVPDLLDSSP